MASPVQRKVCGWTTAAIVSHIVSLAAGASCSLNFNRRLLKAPREWQEPKAIRVSFSSGYDASALDSWMTP